jgi:hypothetical protein
VRLDADDWWARDKKSYRHPVKQCLKAAHECAMVNTFEDNRIAQVVFKFRKCRNPGATDIEKLESELPTRVEPTETFSDGITNGIRALRLRKYELPALTNNAQ